MCLRRQAAGYEPERQFHAFYIVSVDIRAYGCGLLYRGYCCATVKLHSFGSAGYHAHSKLDVVP